MANDEEIIIRRTQIDVGKYICISPSKVFRIEKSS